MIIDVKLLKIYPFVNDKIFSRIILFKKIYNFRNYTSLLKFFFLIYFKLKNFFLLESVNRK